MYLLENQIDRAVENFKGALEQGRKLYHGQPAVADVLTNLEGPYTGLESWTNLSGIFKKRKKF